MRYPHIYEICEKKDTRCYCPTEEQKIKDKEEINHIFNKPYPATYEENMGILNRWFKFDLTLLDLGAKPELFTDEDFYDWSHLNACGAKKVTEQINDFFRSM